MFLMDETSINPILNSRLFPVGLPKYNITVPQKGEKFYQNVQLALLKLEPVSILLNLDSVVEEHSHIPEPNQTLL